MEDKSLFYELTDVTTPQQVEKAYKHAIANNYKFYRCLSKSKAVYGWVNGAYKKAEEGQEWFLNPMYKPTSTTTATPTIPAIESEKATPNVKATTNSAQATLNAALEAIKKEADKYEDLYNAKCVEYQTLTAQTKANEEEWKRKYNEANCEWENKYLALKADYEAIAKNYNVIMQAAKVFVTLANEVKGV